MGKITDTENIGGLEHGKIWDSRYIGGYPGSESFKIASYRVAAGSTQEHSFTYPTSLITSVFAGALLKIDTPAEAVAPLTWTSSDTTIATIDGTGLVTWKTAGTVTFTLTDVNGVTASATFAPVNLYSSAGVSESWSTALANCTAQGGIMPMHTDLTTAKPGQYAQRGIGTFWGEWGDVSEQAFTASASAMWCSDRESGDPYTVSYLGQATPYEEDLGTFDGICLITSAFRLSQYITAPGTTQAYTFQYPAQLINTVWDGAQIQIVIPASAVLPLTCTSSDSSIAEIDSNGLVTWHTAGSVTFTVTDSAGGTGQMALSPALFFVPNSDATTRNHTDTVNYLTTQSLRLPTDAEVTLGQSVRGIGTLWSEWGDFDLNGSNWLGLADEGKLFHYWTSVASSKGHHVIYLESNDGQGNGHGKLMDFTDSATTVSMGVRDSE